MGLELPGWLTEPLGWIGLTWPEADEELLFEAGAQWIGFGTNLISIAENADAAAKQVWSTTVDDKAVNAFEDWWTRDEGPQKRLPEDAAAAQIMGAALIVFAVVTLAMKIAFIVQLVILAIEVAQAIATAVVSFGATAAEVPGFIAATRVVCRQLIKQVVEHIRTVIKDLLEKAKGLFKKVFTREGRTAAREAKGLVSGARFRPGPLHPRHAKWEEDAYNAIRNDTGDIDAIARNVSGHTYEDGLKLGRDEIEQIKNHVFHEEHLLDKYGEGEMGRFAADGDMAEAWMRLRNGTARDEDYVLLRHEYEESQYMKANPGVGYSEAHNHANGIAKWEDIVPPSTREDLEGYGT